MMLFALIALAQAPAAPSVPPPPPEFQTAAQAFGECLGRGASAVPATVAPDAGAQQVVTGCTTQRAALDKQFDAWLANPAFPAASRESARTQYKARLGDVPAQLSTALAQRSAAPTPGAPPTPGATPKPGGR